MVVEGWLRSLEVPRTFRGLTEVWQLLHLATTHRISIVRSRRGSDVGLTVQHLPLTAILAQTLSAPEMGSALRRNLYQELFLFCFLI